MDGLLELARTRLAAAYAAAYGIGVLLLWLDELLRMRSRQAAPQANGAGL